ncbi:MAG: hypothetical protein ACU0DK_05605 [Pseudooceanicola sp.]
MDAQVIAILILLPFGLAFVYAGIHEYRRYKSDGRANYGLVYDEESGTTHVTAIGEDQEPYDPEDYDPSEYNDREIRDSSDEDKS